MTWLAEFEPILTRNRDLAPLTTYRLGGQARYFFEPRNREEVAVLIAACRREGQEIRVMGGGANVLIEEGLHDIAAIHLKHLNRLEIDAETGKVAVDAGVTSGRLVRETIALGLGGCERLAGIPGELGGLVAMNAGGRHGEIAALVTAVEWVDLEGRVLSLSPAECHFAYRRSRLSEGVVVGAQLQLEGAKDAELLRQEAAAILQAKRDSQPLSAASGGCIFANPKGHSAGALVEELGLKGRRVGDAEISTLHGNFILNGGQAKFSDVLALIEEVEDCAKSKRGLSLRREIKIWRACPQ